MDTSEKNFEEAIESALVVAGKYVQGSPDDYDRAACWLPRTVLDFIYATQPREWDKLKKQYGKDTEERFFKRLIAEIEKRGTLDVLRKGIKDSGSTLKLAYFRPATQLNPDVQRLYEGNIFTVVRQVHYSERNENSLDMVLFLNGLPIFTAELKNPFKGQDVTDAIRQYRADRDPREPLFAFARCLAHFAVDPNLVYMTSALEGPKTRFLPFNKGRYGGAGNSQSARSFATSYLWEQIWARDSVLNLIQHFIMLVEEESENGRKTKTQRQIFPRYHQLDAVRRLVADARQNGPGQRYLIQHSAGSGKSNSIAWLAHQLSTLHDDQDRRVFDSIIVVTDRRVLDRQLQTTVRQFEQTLGLVENIDTTSRQLKEALESGKTIIVTTLQKFPVIANEIGTLPGKRFAVIVDEAHSSQSGESTKSLKQVLAARSLEEAEAEEGQPEGPGDDLEDRVVAEMRARGRLPNLSLFAFTATPKAKTMQLFGIKRPDGRYEPFSLYSMRQAIEEQFILDVLQNYTTYGVYWNLLKKIEDDPRYDRNKAAYLLRSFVDLHDHAIAKKVAIIVEHFADQSSGRIGGKAKAMIVTRSRLHAVRYKQAVDRYLAERKYPYKVLVAFSGTVHDGGIDYTEANMNRLPEAQTAETFKRDEYRFLIVANKFQTGFDQPLLHTMYVDRKLGGVHAVQTLSRLNRVYPGKEETMVLDFANEAEDIQKAFEPYYEKTLLAEGTDPNLLYDIQANLLAFRLYDESDVNRFAGIYFNPKATQDKLHAALDPIVERFTEGDAEARDDFRSALTSYVRLYAFLSQVITFVDADLEKLYVFGRLLLRKLPIERDRLPVEVQQSIDIESYRVQQTRTGKIELKRGTQELPSIGPQGSRTAAEELEALSAIIRVLNERFGTDFTEEDRVFIKQLEERIATNPALESSVRVNTKENARLTFDHVANELFEQMIDANFKFYKQVRDNPEFSGHFFDLMFDRYWKSVGLQR